jgi:hypothetical protein
MRPKAWRCHAPGSVKFRAKNTDETVGFVRAAVTHNFTSGNKGAPRSGDEGIPGETAENFPVA